MEKNEEKKIEENLGETQEKKPKKRGRKPKKKIIEVKEEKQNIPENFVIKLNHKIENNDLIKPFDSDNNIFEYSNSVDNTRKVGELCWNCCHPFNNIIYGIPLKYIENIFYIYGDFCSLECCGRYVMDNFLKTHEIISLIKLYNNKINNCEENNIEIAPNKLLLKIFGGDLTIEEYRGNFTNSNNIQDIKIPPILPISHTIDSYEINTISNKSNLKLYRKTPVISDDKNISKSMNLSINNKNN